MKPGFATEQVYFETEKQFREGVLGVYSKLVYFYNYRANNFLHDVRLLMDDDLTVAGGNPFEVFQSLNADNGRVSDYYRYLYQVVVRASTILELIDEKGEDVYASEATMNNNRGELLFLRAFGNFQLWNYYGVSPLVTERSNPDNLYPTNSTDTQLLDQAITDLNEAVSLLPDSWPDSEKGRVTKSGALALLGKSLVFRGTVKKTSADFQSALTAFNQIPGIDAPLSVNFGDNFKTATENNAESLFEVQLGKCAIMCNVWLATDDFSGNGDISGYWGIFDNHWSLFGAPPFVPTQSLKNAFDPADPRYAFTLANNGDGVQKYVEGYGGDPETSSGVSYFNNARIIRLADVKLLKAEALVQSGGSMNAAIQLINDVRRRARESATPASNTPADLSVSEMNKTTVLRWIIEERRLELAFEEGHRWFDLRRWHMGGVLNEVYGRDLTSWDFSSIRPEFEFEQKNLYLPIPISELQLNRNLQQNEVWK